MVLYEEADVSGSAVNEGFNRRLAGELAEMQEQGVYKTLLHIMGMQGAVVELEEFGETVNLCSNNYVGLCDVPEVVEAVRDGATIMAASFQPRSKASPIPVFIPNPPAGLC